MELLRRDCPLCLLSNRERRVLPWSQLPWELKECARCGFVYLENPPAYEALSETLAWEQTSSQERARRRNAEPLLQSVSRGVSFFRHSVFKRDKLRQILDASPAGGNLLDLGCGRGRSFDSVPPAFTPFGIEISKKLAAEAHERAVRRGGRAIQASALDGVKSFPSEFFHAAVLRSFLEHEAHPRELLTALSVVLAPAAEVILKVPNFGSVNRRFRGARWCGFRFPDHVNYFTPRTLRLLVEKCGFNLKRFAFQDRNPLSDNMWMIAVKPG